uniref:Protein TsetseEP domain-containing protein n=1 Tax=Clastoptera arizonana TaxID=38151 RepID=A0A1B6D7I0_9HEMI
MFWGFLLSIFLLNEVNSLTEVQKAVDSELQQFYRVKYLGAPLLLSQLSNYSLEAKATMQLAEQLTQGKIVASLTKVLRPYRAQVNQLARSLTYTPAVECVYVNKTYIVVDANTDESLSVPLVETARNITDLCFEHYSKCVSNSLSNLQGVLSELNMLETKLKSEFIDKGEGVFQNCSNQPTVQKALDCVKIFMDDLRLTLDLFVQVFVINGSLETSEVFSSDIFNEDLYMTSNCLLNSGVEASGAANSVLRDIQSCADSFGVSVTINEIPEIDPSSSLLDQYKFIEDYYRATRSKTLAEVEYNIFINYLSLEIAKARKILSQDMQTTLNSHAGVKAAVRIAAQSRSIPLKICVYKATKYIRMEMAQQQKTARACVESSLNYTLRLQASLNSSYSLLLSDPYRSEHITQIPLCISRNLLNTTNLQLCASAVMSGLELTLDHAEMAYDWSVIEIAEYTVNNKNVNSCINNATSLVSLGKIYQCDEQLFDFLSTSEIDPSLIL